MVQQRVAPQSRLVSGLAVVAAALGAALVIVWVYVRMQQSRTVALYQEEEARALAELEDHKILLGFVRRYDWVEQVDLHWPYGEGQRPLCDELIPLRRLGALWSLYISNFQLSNESFYHLSTLSGLQNLEFSSVDVPGVALTHLTKLPALQCLSFRGSSLSDADVEPLVELSGLYSLEVQSCPLTDASVGHLSKMKFLSRLTLDNTFISQDGVVELRTALCRTDIQWTPWDPEDRRPGSKSKWMREKAGSTGGDSVEHSRVGLRGRAR